MRLTKTKFNDFKGLNPSSSGIVKKNFVRIYISRVIDLRLS